MEVDDLTFAQDARKMMIHIRIFNDVLQSFDDDIPYDILYVIYVVFIYFPGHWCPGMEKQHPKE